MNKMDGKEVMKYLEERRGAYVKVKYINEITPVYADEVALSRDEELPESEYLKLDYDIKEKYMYGNYPSSLDVSSVAIGVSSEYIKGWMDEAGELWIIGVDDVYIYPTTDMDQDVSQEGSDREHLYLLHLPTGNKFISTNCLRLDIEEEDWETRLSLAEEMFFDCKEKKLHEVRLTGKIIEECAMWEDFKD